MEQLKERVETSASHTPDKPQELGAFWLEGLVHTQRVHLWDYSRVSHHQGRGSAAQVKGGSISSMEEKIPLSFGTYFLFVCLIFSYRQKTKLLNSRSIHNCEFPTKRRQVSIKH